MTAHLLVAEFPDARSGRSAVVQLERRGAVDSDRIELHDGVSPIDETRRRESDAHLGRFLSRRALPGMAAGALVGAALGAGVSVLVGMEPQPMAAVATAIAVGVFVAALVGFWTVGAALPVTEQAMEEPGGSGPVQVVIHLGDPDDEALLRPHLEASGARQVERISR